MSLPPSSASLHSTVVSSNSSAKRGAARGRRLEVVPARALGPYRIGAPLHAVVSLLQGEVHGVPAAGPIAIGTLPDGAVRIFVDDASLALTFDPRTQRLAVIEVCSLANLELSHKEGMLCGKGATPTFVRLYDVLGPTFAGEMNRESGEYVLTYPGLDVIFRVPAEFRDRYLDGHGDHPIQFPDGTTPVALALIVREDRDGALTAPVADPFAQPWSTVTVHWGLGITLQPAEPARAMHRAHRLLFGASTQDALAILGPPESVMAKGDERLMIHNSEGRDGGPATHPLYCLGFPSYGIDLVFSSYTDSLVKIVLYSGAKGHEAFLRYAKCHFSVAFDGERTAKQWLGTSDAAEPSDTDPGSKAKFITADTPWKAVSDMLTAAGKTKGGYRLPRPLLATAADGTLSLWAMNGIIFSVTQAHDEIASVTLVPASALGLPRADEKSHSPPPVLAYRTPTASKTTSPEVVAAAPPVAPEPIKRVAVSADFDECEEFRSPTQAPRQNSNSEVFKTFGFETYSGTRGPVAAGPGMPQPTLLRHDSPTDNASSRFQFAYPGFVDDHDRTPTAEPSSDPRQPRFAGDQSGSPDGSQVENTTVTSTPFGPQSHTLTFTDELPGPMLSHESDPAASRHARHSPLGASGRNSHGGADAETDYAEDAFESLQPTEQQMLRGHYRIQQQQYHYHVDATVPVAEEEDTEVRYYPDPDPEADYAAEMQQHDAAYLDRDAVQQYDEVPEEEQEEPAPQRLTVEAVTPTSDAPRRPVWGSAGLNFAAVVRSNPGSQLSPATSFETSRETPQGKRNGTSMEDARASVSIQGSPAVVGQRAPTNVPREEGLPDSGESDTAGETTENPTPPTRDCSPAVDADDEVTPPVTPNMTGGKAPTGGIALHAPKKPKGKKGKKR
jgi:hypothetical protein